MVADVVESLVGTRPLRDEPLLSAGVTSTVALQLASELEGRLATELPATLVFDYPTVAELAAHVGSMVQGGREGPAGMGDSGLAAEEQVRGVHRGGVQAHVQYVLRHVGWAKDFFGT